MKNHTKYSPGYYPPPSSRMDWVKKDHIEKAPIWCSVDLRDGNQALIVPMSLEEKLEFFKVLCNIGFKQIEVGFPAASDTEYEFLRALIEKDLIPDDVQVQVLTQSREHIIDKTFQSLVGAKSAIVHLYNSTSFAQRQQVFRATEDEIKQIAIDGAKLMNEYKAPQKLIEATIQSNEVRKDHIVNCIVEKLKGVKEPIVGIYGLPGKYSALLDIINRLKGKNVRMLIYSNNHDMKSFDGVEVTDQFGRFIVDSSLVLSEQELPVEFKNSDKIYLK